MRESLRESGIDVIGNVPWGTHLCQFYQTKEDLVEILVPYFKAGLENNELCVWITSQHLEVEEAKEAIRRAVPDIEIYMKKGQMEIIRYTHEYINEGVFDPDRVINSWIEKINQAQAMGYDGLRATGDSSWLEKKGWDDFDDYEKKVDALIDKNLIIALCPYDLEMCSTAEIIDVVSNHQFALIKKEGKWARIENSGRKRAEKEAIQAAKNWKYTFDAVPDLVAIIDNECRIAHANRAMAERLGMTPEECVGLTCYHIFHGIDKPPSFCPHRQLLKGGAEYTAQFCEDCPRGNFMVSITPLQDSEGKISGSVYVARDVNKLKKEEHRIRRYNRILEAINRIFSNVVQAKTEEELGEVCLSVALEITGSQFGFINEMGADGLLHDVAKSELGWEQCLMYDKTGHRHLPSDYNVRGLYGSVVKNEKSFFTNDPLLHPDSIGLPDGHPPITSFLGVPLSQDGETVGLIAVANREGGYSCEQQVDLETIAPAVTQALQRKKAEQKREQAEKALKVSEERYRSLYENSLDGILLTKPDGTILCANPQACQMFGMTEDEIVRAGRKGIVINDEKLAAALEERKRTGRMRAELIHRRKDGSTFICDTTSKLFVDADGSLNTSLIIRDVSERKRVEKALLKSDERFRSVLENSLDSAYRMDLQVSYFDFMSPVIEKITGFSVKEIRAMSNSDLLDRIHPDDRPRIIAEIAQSLEEGFGAHEYRFKCKDGKYCWLADHFSIIKDKNGMARFRTGIVRNITRRKKAEEAIRLSNIYNRSLIEASLDPLVTIGHDGKITDVNKATEQVTGYSRNELIGTDFSDYFTEPQEARKGYEQVFTDGKVRDYPLEIQHKDGHITPVLYNASVYKDEAGKVIGVFAAARDITERKKAEEKLKFASKYNRSLIEASLDPLVTIGPDGKITDVNNSTEAITGHSRDELIGTDFSDYFTEPEKAKEGYQCAFKKGLVRDYSLEIQRKDGHIIPVLYNASVYKDENDEVIGVFAAARDITELRKAEEKIQILANAVEFSEDAIVTKSLDGIILSWNRGAEKVYGYSAEEVLGKNISILEPDNHKGEIKRFSEKIKQGEKVQHYETSRLKKNGTIIDVSVTLSPIFDTSGKLVAVSTIARNITERKKAEEVVKKAYDNLEKLVKERTAELEKAYASLKESEKGLTEAQRIAHIGNWDWNLVTGKMHWSEELYRIFRRNPQDLAPSSNEFLSYVHPDDRDYVEKSIKKGLKEEPKNGINYRIILANGEERTVYSRAEVIFDEQKIPVRVKGIVQDITERKKTEEKIQILANAVESSNDAILTFSLEGTILSWNKGAEQIYGYSAEEIIGKNISITEPNDLKGEIKLFSQKLKQGEKSQHYETVRLKKDGTKVNISAIISPVFKESGEFVAILAIGRDITERKREEKSLRESEARLRRFYESDMFGVIYYRIDGSIADANDKFLELVGYSREDLQAGRINWRNITPSEYCLLDEQALEELKTTGRNVVYEKDYIRKDGSHVSIILGATAFDREGQEGIAFVIDNTERKKAEEALAEIDRIRIKEIHHRIKNNLQVISSLLDLQAEKFQNKQVLEAFRESQNRVISMALIHEELYKGEGMDNLNFSAYLQELAENLLKTYCLKSKNIYLLMDLEENAFFDMDTAVPLGIIVNELVSNSLKHAFPEKEGEIQIKLFREENNDETGKSLFSLTISDNGKGIPENIELENLESLGLQLVNTLVDQLDGELEFKREHGTEFRITFSVTEYHNSG